jgi:hypothetical protein
MKQQAFFSVGHWPAAPVPRQKAYLSGSILSLGLTGLLLLGGCNKQPVAPAPAAEPVTAAQTPSPASPTPATEQAPATSAAEPAPAAQAPQPAPPPMASPAVAPPAVAAAPPPPPPPVQYTVPAGTALVVRMEQTVSAKNNNVGDSFSGALAQSVLVRGVSVLRAGTRVTGTVVASKGQGRFKGDGALGIAIQRVGNYSVSTTSYEKTAGGKGKRSAGFIGGGGGGGALIGGLAGGGKGALIGGLLGAGAGTAGAAFTGNKDVSVPAESVVTFRLAAPVTVTKAVSQ